MAHDVFISHSSKDKIIADAVCAMLEQNRIRCWIAPRDITPGKEWGEAIIDAISGSRVMILIFSANANGSPQIRREVERAVNKEVVVVPLRIENVVPTKALEYFIGSVHWFDALTEPFEMHLDKLVRVVQGALAGAIDQQSIPGVQELHAAALAAISSGRSIPPEVEIGAHDKPHTIPPKSELKPPSPTPGSATTIPAQTQTAKPIWRRFAPAGVGVLLVAVAILYFSGKPFGTSLFRSATTGSASSAASNVLALKTDKDKLSYAFGMNKGLNLRGQSIDADSAVIARGVKDVLAGRSTLLTSEEAQTAMKQFQDDVSKSQEQKTQQPRTENDKVAYAIGMDFGKLLQKLSVDVDPNILAQGLKDALAGNKTLLAEDEAKKLQSYATFHAYEELAKPGKAYLLANKSKPGVVTIPSGLQYKILTQGRGPKPTANDTVVCNYRGTLINGTEFDSSYKRGQPATLAVTDAGVIKGWTEALQLMPVGSKWQLFIPSDLAYGGAGKPPDVGPEAALIFEIQLISIQPKTR
jgi:FKBP-type peptidyl-prolyl cis-trans isomerase FklB